MSGVERTHSDLRRDEDKSDEERETEENKTEETNLERKSSQKNNTPTDDEGVKLALASFFSDSRLQGEVDDDSQNQLTVEDIPERVRPILLEKWRRLRSSLDSSRSRGSANPYRDDTSKSCHIKNYRGKRRYF